MRYSALVRWFALSLSLLSAVAASHTTPAAPSAELRTHLQTEEFDIVSSMRGLPLGVRSQLQMLWGTRSIEIADDIADPRGKFRATGVGDPRLPVRRLIAAGCARDNHCLVYYERGGPMLTQFVLLYQWRPDATRFEWSGAAPAGLATIDAVRKAILSGAIKGNTNGPW